MFAETFRMHTASSRRLISPWVRAVRSLTRVAAVALAVVAAPAVHAQAACDADIDGDGVVGAPDLAALLGEWGSCKGCAADLDGSGDVSAADLASLLSLWGATCAPLPWATVLEFAPNPAVVTNESLREAIAATGFPWRVRDNGTQIEMLLVPPGTYDMGCSETICTPAENPVHAVTLTNALYIGRYEVTQAQWAATMGSNPSYFQSPNWSVPATHVPKRPVEQVSWNMIQVFLSATGLRLPTEAEWEYACRAGTTTLYHSTPGSPNGTNSYLEIANIAWFVDNSGQQTRPVGGRAANALGLHDMSGNVEELVNDWYSATYYASSASTNPPGPATGWDRVRRGGSYEFAGHDTRSAYRASVTPGSASRGLGFRVARSAGGATTLSSVAPSSGPPEGGTTITLTGNNLDGVLAVTVGGVPATDVTFVGGTTVTAVTPAGPAGAKTVTITALGGTSTLPDAFTYFLVTPTLASVSPDNCGFSGGAAVTLTGTNFDGTTAVTFGGTSATSFTVLNSNTILAITPARAAGVVSVSVTTPGGTATLPRAFTYTTNPEWYTVVEEHPDPAVVTSAALRNSIVATGLPWRVIDQATGIEMLLIPPGTFNMGCSSSSWPCISDENPVHPVTLTYAFYLGRYEVTQAQWIARIGSNPSFFQSASAEVPAAQVPNRPV